MKQGQTIECMAVCIAILLVTQVSVYAAHFIAGGGRFSLTSNTSEAFVRFQFLGVLRVSDTGVLVDPVVPVIETHIQFAIVHPIGSMPFWLFTSGIEIDPFTVASDPPAPPPPDRHIITITGRMLSKLVWGVEPDDHHLTEIVDFEVKVVDAKTEADTDFLTLILYYNENQPTARRLLETLGMDLVKCGAGICTVTLAGILTEGEIESHTTGGE